jgi:hypothetical protein
MEYESEDSTPFVMSFNINPVNFRNVIQRSIERAVNKEIDTIVAYNKMRDGRFHSTFPVKTINIMNAKGNAYFVVGASRVNCANVAAP